MYATVAQADTYVGAYYSSTDPLALSWKALSAGDKQILLNRAEQTIDQLPLTGHGTIVGKAFPRDPDQELSLAQAQLATIELAVQRLGSVDAQERLALQRQGVHSYRIGDLSETFGGSGGYKGLDDFAFMVVFPYIKDWLGGGYTICPTHTRR